MLKISDVSFITSDTNYQKVLEVVKRKFKKLHRVILKNVIEEVDRAFEDIKIIPEKEWKTKFEDSKFLSR